MKKKLLSGIICLLSLLPTYLYGAAPDTLRILDLSDSSSDIIPEKWRHVLPNKVYAPTQFSIVKGSDGSYIRAISSASDTWLECIFDDVDVSKYPVMEWQWKVDQFPETTWEENKNSDDYAIRIELVYDLKGSKYNILNIVRKGLFTTIFRGYPPELIVGYVWSLNTPPEKAYESPRTRNMMIIPIESDVALQGRFAHESRNIRQDLETFKGVKTSLVLKKIRFRSDTIETGSNAESGLRYINLLATEKSAEQ